MQDRAHQLADRAAARQPDDAEKPQPEPPPPAEADPDAVAADDALSGLQAETYRKGR